MTYEEVTNELISVGAISAADVFYYEHSPLKDEFDAYFRSSTEKLLASECRHQIRPARFFFENDLSINAWAGPRAGHNVIAINLGLFGAIHSFTTQANPIFANPAYQRYNIDNLIGFSKEYLMFQIAMQFAFYHEQTHLIQRANATFTENYFAALAPAYSEFKHVHEIDADLRASHLCAMHILGCWESLPVQQRTAQNLENITVLGISGIFILLLHLSGSQPLYYRASTHPHPLIRLTYLLDHITLTLRDNESAIISSQRNLLTDVVHLVHAIYTLQGYGSVANYATVISNQYAFIETYINDQFENCKKYQNLVMNTGLQD